MLSSRSVYVLKPLHPPGLQQPDSFSPQRLNSVSCLLLLCASDHASCTEFIPVDLPTRTARLNPSNTAARNQLQMAAVIQLSRPADRELQMRARDKYVIRR